MNLVAPLLSIVAYARSGALDHAWRLFGEAGLNRIDDDPAVLSVRGRLLKDRALAAPAGPERRGYYLEAAEAYARAGELGGATYPLINAATLARLAGQGDRARALAGRVLERIEQGGGEPDTPYYVAATRAEALLLLDRTAEAKAAFAAAIALAPRAWEDHASTLRQFALILDEAGEGKDWLDAHRPPRSLHFAGHMAMGSDETAIGRQIRRVLDEEKIGFGFGALAAGADILIAEALLERGAELHLILPGGRQAFREASVSSFNGRWAGRFEAAADRADTIRSVGPSDEPVAPIGVLLGAEVAMGQAVMQAQTLASEAVQLLILDETRSAQVQDGASGWIRTLWQASGRRQHVLAAPRARPRPARDVALTVDPQTSCLAASLVLDLSSAEGGEPASAGRLVDAIFPALSQALTGTPAPMVAPRWTPDSVSLAYPRVGDAARAALALADALRSVADLRVAGGYGIAHPAIDPFDRTPILLGRMARTLAEVMASIPPGAIHVTEDFAAALFAGPADGRPRAEYVGDLATSDPEQPIRLFSLKR